MYSLVPFKSEHVTGLLEHPINEPMKEVDYAQLVGPTSFTIMRDGKVAACGGWVSYWPGRAYCWVMFDCNLGGHQALGVFRMVARAIHSLPIKRLELAVPLQLNYTSKALRRAFLLGFQCETPNAVCFFGDDAHAALFSRVRGN